MEANVGVDLSAHAEGEQWGQRYSRRQPEYNCDANRRRRAH
jgi:hypothetical protein